MMLNSRNEMNIRSSRLHNFTLIIMLLTVFSAFSQVADSTGMFRTTVAKESFNKNIGLDLAVQDKIQGLFVVAKSGMPNEGAYFNLRGIHTFIASNTPLLVLNGIPYQGNEEVSDIIRGYSRSLFSSLNVNDIKSVRVLSGAEAAQYGSLGSNGVIYIETEQATSDNLDTRISFSSSFGVRVPNRSIPTLGSGDFKNYLQDIGTTRYDSHTALNVDYPFLQSGDNFYSYLFNNSTDWRSLIQSPALVTDNVFRVEGGDAIAKYNLSFGYSSDGGVIGKTGTERYNTSINTNIMVSRKVNIFANVGLSYLTGNLQEQGIIPETNPLLAASLAMPVLSPYKKEPDGNLLPKLAAYNEWNVNASPAYAYDNVSNPLAIVNTLRATDKIYDANIRLGLNYHYNRYLTLTGQFNMNINYTEEGIFIPGVTDHAILPQYFGTGYNTVRKGVIQNRSDYAGLNAEYRRTFEEIHDFRASAGVRFMNNSVEYDFASGYNTSNDFYSALNYVTENKRIKGRNMEWKWLGYYVGGNYTYQKMLKADLMLAIDGSSVSGMNAPRFGLFPSLKVTAMLAEMDILPDAFSSLNVSLEASRTGNSRFSSNYSKNYYQNSNLFNLGTIVRMNVPNTNLEWEKNDQIDLGVEMSLLNNFVSLKADYFFATASDLLVARNISGVYGSSEYYDNTGKIASNGLELGVSVQLIRSRDIDWTIGASVANAKSTILSLGNSDELFINLQGYNNDDAMIVMRKGESPYQFYGYRTNGIYARTSDAVDAGLKNIYGNNYQGGDVIFINTNESDKVINAKDKVLLGSATPDYFGNFSSSFRYHSFVISAGFGYSVGNKAYNAMRRELESMKTFRNQSVSVMNRWQVEGQDALLPRSAYGDPAGNNIFSDRWIEDASYLKLRNLTLQYNFGSILNLCQSGNVYVSGENLLTLTRYLGSDPEFSYAYSPYMQGIDYAKAARPVTVQFGFQLFF